MTSGYCARVRCNDDEHWGFGRSVNSCNEAYRIAGANCACCGGPDYTVKNCWGCTW